MKKNPIKRFQKKYGLIADGILGRNTARAMQRAWDLGTLEAAHFLGQTSHETLNFTRTEENLNYSYERLLQVFKLSNEEKQFAKSLIGHPEKIANFIYANKNGNEEADDGWNFRGRGSIMLTGRSNYERFAQKKHTLCILETPEIVGDRYFLDAGLFFFNENNLWDLCCDLENETIKKLTREINGGYNGLQNRIKKTKYYWQLLTI